MRDLFPQRLAVVRWRFRCRGFAAYRAKEEATPAPRRIVAPASEHGDKVAPPIRSSWAYLNAHSPILRTVPASLIADP